MKDATTPTFHGAKRPSEKHLFSARELHRWLAFRASWSTLRHRFTTNPSTMTPFENAFVAHLVGDWLLQNDWMARHKITLGHPAAWIHSAIHGVLLGLVVGWIGGLVLGVVHMLVDTRVPQRWWGRVFRQTTSGPLGDHVQIWGDQVIHISAIALWFHLSPLLPA